MADIFISNEACENNFAGNLKNILSNYGHVVSRYDDISGKGLSPRGLEAIRNVDVLVLLVSINTKYPYGGLELGAALALSKERSRPAILTLVLGNARIPQILMESHWIKINERNSKMAARIIDDFTKNMPTEQAEPDDVELNKNDPLILLLGNVDHEGVLSTIRTIGRQHKKKMLESKPENWDTIVNYFSDFKVKGVLAKFNGRTFTMLSRNGYMEVAHRLLTSISSVPNKVFIFENLLTGNFEEKDDDFHQPSEANRETVVNLIESYNINIVPYKSNAEVTVMATTFLMEMEQNLLFRLYVPAGRMWADETDRLLQMFRDYLTRVGHLSARLDQYRTDQGIIYEFHGEEPKSDKSLATEFEDFTLLMDLCISNPSAAEAILVEKNVAPREILEIVTKYSKEAKRLQVDLKHDRERKLLGIRQRLESELVDVFPATTDWTTISALVEASVPGIAGTSSALCIDRTPLAPIPLDKFSHVTLNLKPQIIQTVNGIVAQEICGNQYLTSHDHELLSLIQQHGKEKIAELSSAVHELADKSAPPPARLNAKQKLKKFLIDVGSHAGDIATGILQKYIENQMGM